VWKVDTSVAESNYIAARDAALDKLDADIEVANGNFADLVAAYEVARVAQADARNARDKARDATR
jgi:hypothetical protein